MFTAITFSSLARSHNISTSKRNVSCDSFLGPHDSLAVTNLRFECILEKSLHVTQNFLSNFNFADEILEETKSKTNSEENETLVESVMQ